MRTMVQGLLVLALSGAGLAGCNTEDPFATMPTPTPTTVVFQGEINPNGGQTFQFTTQANGTITATLTAVQPSGATIGFSMGIWNTSTTACQIVLANDNAAQGAVLTGTASSVGNYCVRVYDTGALSDSASFTIQLVHP
jgi:hypothetical protein